MCRRPSCERRRSGRRTWRWLRWTPRERGRYRLLATGAGLSSAPASVFVREVTLAAVGDVNLGDGVARVMRSRGRAYPWRHVGRALRAADLTFGNLECAVSRRGHALPKAFTFRGSPGALAVARRRGIAAVGGGFDYHQAHRARILVRRDVRRARHRADVVVVSFHWGVERSTRPNRRQHALARAVLGAGADAVIGHHPHVQQPVRRAGGHRLVAWSLGNFVFVPGGPRTITGRTRILKLRLSGRGVEGFSQRRYRIHSGQPR